jgi:hypothetical protein
MALYEAVNWSRADGFVLAPRSSGSRTFIPAKADAWRCVALNSRKSSAAAQGCSAMTPAAKTASADFTIVMI